jgi:hypothetical protein
MVDTHDVFISYAHLDNRPLSPEQSGWISRLHYTLRVLLAMRLGREPKIWRDDKLQGNDEFDAEIIERLKAAELFVSVLSPRYLASGWCPREAREFCSATDAKGGPKLGNKSRLFKLIKTPVVEDERLPRPLRDTLGYPFFKRGEGEEALELDPAYGDELLQAFNRKVALLAWNLAQYLTFLERGVALERKGSVYVAETSYDRTEEREAIVADLELSGYEVLPAHTLPHDEQAYVAEVTNLLERSSASVHVIGGSPGSVIDGPKGRSSVELQNEIAARLSAEKGLRRVIWLSDGTRAARPEFAAFLKALTEDPSKQVGAELVTGDVESAKLSVRAALKPRSESSAGKRALPMRPLVYVVCTREDRLETVPLLKALSAAGLDPKLPLFEGSAADVRAAHESMLRECAAAVIFYGRGDEAWYFHCEAELRKARALREGPIDVRLMYVSAPRTDDKTLKLAVEQRVADATDTFPADAVATFARDALGGDGG